MKRALIVVLSTVLTVLGLAGVASANPPNIDQCKSGGYASYVDPATSSPYVTQGRCVSVIARGGVLVPVVPPVSVGSWAQVQAQGAASAQSAELCVVSSTLTGQASTTIPLTWLVDGVATATEDVTTSAGGTVAVSHQLTEGTSVQLVADDQTFSLPTINCNPPTPTARLFTEWYDTSGPLDSTTAAAQLCWVEPSPVDPAWYAVAATVNGSPVDVTVTSSGVTNVIGAPSAANTGSTERCMATLYVSWGDTVEYFVDGVSVGSIVAGPGPVSVVSEQGTNPGSGCEETWVLAGEPGTAHTWRANDSVGGSASGEFRFASNGRYTVVVYRLNHIGDSLTLVADGTTTLGTYVFGATSGNVNCD